MASLQNSTLIGLMFLTALKQSFIFYQERTRTWGGFFFKPDVVGVKVPSPIGQSVVEL